MRTEALTIGGMASRICATFQLRCVGISRHAPRRRRPRERRVDAAAKLAARSAPKMEDSLVNLAAVSHPTP